MISSRKLAFGALALAGSLALLTQTYAYADESYSPVQVIQKNDGSVGIYRLLPLQDEPDHELEVQQRLEQSVNALAAVPSKYQIPSSYIPNSRDQGARSSCAYFATVGLLESYYLRNAPRKRIKLSEECLLDVRNWMYDQGRAYGGRDRPAMRPDSNGDLPVSIIRTVTNNGVPLAASYRSANCIYNGNDHDGSAVSLSNYLVATASSPNPRSTFGKGVSFRYNSNPTIADIRNEIASNRPVEVAIIVYQRFMGTHNWSYNPATDTMGSIIGGHAVILVGYQVVGGKTVFFFKNSWGSAWGQSGYGTIDESLLIKSWGLQRNFDFITSL
jgi:hypothetical protein